MMYRFVLVVLAIMFSIFGGFQGCGKSDKEGPIVGGPVGGPIPIGAPIGSPVLPGIPNLGVAVGCIPLQQNAPDGMHFDLNSQPNGSKPQIQGFYGQAMVVAPGLPHIGNPYTKNTGTDTVTVYTRPDGTFSAHARLGIDTINLLKVYGATCVDGLFFDVSITSTNGLYGPIYVLSQGRTLLNL